MLISPCRKQTLVWLKSPNFCCTYIWNCLFNCFRYVDNFLECCVKGLGCRVDRDKRLIHHDGRTIRAQSFPIGIPFAQFEKMARETDIETISDKSLKMILGVDRLDYTKGITHRVLAFEKLLDTYPEHIEKVQMLQIAVPSRTDVSEYQVGGLDNSYFMFMKWSYKMSNWILICSDDVCIGCANNHKNVSVNPNTTWKNHQVIKSLQIIITSLIMLINHLHNRLVCKMGLQVIKAP